VTGMDARVPVTLVTGFLGAGKTTLLHALLRRPDAEPIAVVVNEFGEIALDQLLVGRAKSQVVALGGGCLCCGLGGDLASTLVDLHAERARSPFARVVIETSGLADPGPLLAPFVEDIRLARLFRLDGVVALVDALQGLRELERQKVCVKQIAFADRIVLSKSDIAAPLAVTRLKARIAEINPFAPLRISSHGEVESAWLFAPGADLRDGGGSHDPAHADAIGAFGLHFDTPLTWESFADAVAGLTDAHGEAILRIKGLLNIEGRPVAIHGVQGFLHAPQTLAAWPDDERRSRVIVIADQLSETQVRNFFPAAAN